jgi:aryl-alcohol dehydrogenase-like predicted oxidoreductase
METTLLPTTDLKISRLCLGTMTWGNGQSPEEDAHAQMDYALSQGVNFWDTAEVYAIPPRPETHGKTEAFIGHWLQKTGRRAEVVLASKVSPGRKSIRNGAAVSPSVLEEALHGSFKRLNTDYLDLYQFHSPTPRPYPHHQQHWDFTPATDQAREVEAMHAALEKIGELIKAGKIRAFGLSNDTPWGVMTYLRLAEKFSLPRVASVQNEYSLIYRLDEPYMEEICTLENVGFLPYSPLGMGILTGKYRDGARPDNSRITLAGNSTVHRLTPAVAEAVEAYASVADKLGISLTHLALAWTLTRPFVTSTILGATTLSQLKEDIAAAEVSLPADAVAEIQSIRKRYPLPF